MWRKPTIVIDAHGPQLWGLCVHYRIWSKAFPDLTPDMELNEEVLNKFRFLYGRLAQSLLRIPSDRRKVSKVQNSFQSTFSEIVIGLAKEIEAGRYSFLTQMMWALPRLRQRTESNHAVTTILLLALQATYFLVGEERKYLVGTRGNQPVWRTSSGPLTPWLRSSELIGACAAHLPYIGKDDLDLVPHFDERAPSPEPHDLPDISIDETRAVLEEAYYNQRYVVAQEGATVKITGHPKVRSVELRVRPGINDPNYVDFLARFELDTGSHLVVLAGELGTGQITTLNDDPTERYFYFLIAQIYHDLVTAREVKVMATDPSRGVPAYHEDSQPSWIYIPRRRILTEAPDAPREPMETPRLSEPHRVTIHPRRGIMSKAQRQKIQDWEIEHGLKVMHIANPDQTIVLPHVSPKESTVATARLPRFIKARLQREIDRVLERHSLEPMHYKEG